MPYKKKPRKVGTDKQTWVDWAALNPDLLYIISKKLCDISNFIIFRAVCKAWRDATDIRKPPLQFPCLISWPYVMGSILRVYSPASERSHTFCVPNACFYEPVGQDVLIWSDSDYYYLNPVTNAKKKISYRDPCSDRMPGQIKFSSRINNFVIKYIGYLDSFHYKRPGQDEWIMKVFLSRLRCAAYYKNQYFLLESTNADHKIVVIDENNKQHYLSTTLPNKGSSDYLIATTDHLLAVSVFIPRDLKDPTKSRFEVHRLDNYPKNPIWTKLSGIGDEMLFLDQYTCFSLKASDYSGFKGNCIYFITSRTKSKQNTKYVIGRFDMELNKVEELSGPADLETGLVKATWFVPHM